MIWRTRFSSLAVSTRPQNETVSSKCSALQQWRRDPEAARARVEHLGAKVQRNLARRLYGANGQSPAGGLTPPITCRPTLLRPLFVEGFRSLEMRRHDHAEQRQHRDH